MNPTMTPNAGERLLRFVGDRVRFTMTVPGAPPQARGFLRTDLGRAAQARAELIASLGEARTFAGMSWRDLPLHRDGERFWLDLPLTEVGWFRAKPYVRDALGRQHWPAGDDLGLTVHPDAYRTANTIYCAFPRMFGATRGARATRVAPLDDQFAALDRLGYTVIPPSGKLRDLAAHLPHITSRLGCRILHLLPVTGTPTTYARFGRYGSPYASQDLVAIDPALAEFDRKATAVDQFRELAYATHLHGARLFLDIVVNHTGWGSTLQERHPDWFHRNPDGTFHSPGAWGNTWEDLVELDNSLPALWEAVAASLLTWCRRGVDGFRCDAGYMVPLPAWQYIISRVRDAFPDTVFLLEGLGGSWDATASLMSAGGMQWAYSELFQNLDGVEVATYLDHALAQSARLGALVNYSETHDNDRLAKRGRTWSLMRNRLCALASVNGAFGFTAGVEWLATEKLEVHHSRGLNWNAELNLVDELAVLNCLLADHPCFFDGTTVRRLSTTGAPVLVLRRDAADCDDRVLVLVNLDHERAQTGEVPIEAWAELGAPQLNLLNEKFTAPTADGATMRFRLEAGEALCLAAVASPRGLAGETYRQMRAVAAWAYQALATVVDSADLGPCPWLALAQWAAEDPVRLLAAASALDTNRARHDVLAALKAAVATPVPPPVVRWGLADVTREVLVPPGHWLLVRDDGPFAATLVRPDGKSETQRSIHVREGHIASFAPGEVPGKETLSLERFKAGGHQADGVVRQLPTVPVLEAPAPDSLVLLTNGRGGMGRIGVDPFRITSKYDAVLAANGHADAPSDRQVLVKRLRLWANADGFITALDGVTVHQVEAGPPGRWTFLAPAGDGRTVPITLTVDLLEGRNTVVLRLERQEGRTPRGRDLPPEREVRVIVRLDLEDRSFHSETVLTAEAEQWFAGACQPLEGRTGFTFCPAPARTLRAWVDRGAWHGEGEACRDIPHPVEATRGMRDRGDAYSPGWFELPLSPGKPAHLVLCADADEPSTKEVTGFEGARRRQRSSAVKRADLHADDAFGRQLAEALQAFVVRRGAGRTVIAGYPWFLDWGRDTFIACRGLLAAGFADEVLDIVATFARFEEHGTLPNLLNGDHAVNRDTSDAPLWFGVVVEELAAISGLQVYDHDCAGRPLRQILANIAAGYLRGTPNGIRVDAGSALVFSPPHFTWMDTNFPAGTPREGYPIEIQALWYRLLRQLAALKVPDLGESWSALADRVHHSFDRYWLPEQGWFADNLRASPGQSPDQAQVDDALRSNALLPIALGVITGERARAQVGAATRLLVVPGALRSLAPVPVVLPLFILSPAGAPLIPPNLPYQGHYAGDEDSRRKPAYHNGTAWTWTFPGYCEAMAVAWDRHPAAVAAARAYLGSMALLLDAGCTGQIPEILDGDAPHQQRGCDAQAWGVSEALRVWKSLGT